MLYYWESLPNLKYELNTSLSNEEIHHTKDTIKDMKGTKLQ